MIHILDSLTIDKIAAGEVIDRPASAVKELLENAIDAGSSVISVSIKNGGKSEIIVQDNGCGIEAKELPLATIRHATSKIESFDDLDKVISLGFRGEALASIAAVAKLEIISKRGDSDCWHYQINGGAEKEYCECAGINGTKIIVRDLFYNVPARQKFLKSHVTESNHIGKKVQAIVLSHPEVSFTYTVDGVEKIHTSGSGDINKLIYEVFGRDMGKDGKIIDALQDGIHIHGFLGSPSIGRGNHNYELTYVNNRLVENKAIFHAVEEGYSGFLMEHKYPFVVLYMDIDPHEIDVNVHPTKSDIKIERASELHAMIVRVISSELNSNVMVHNVSLDKGALKAKRFDTYNYFYDKARENSVDSSACAPARCNDNAADPNLNLAEPNLSADSSASDFMAAMKARVQSKYQNEQFGDRSVSAHFHKSEQFGDRSVSAHMTHYETDVKPEQINLVIKDETIIQNDVKIIGQIFDTYWIVQYGDDLLLIDQHAAHEKVLYEKFLKEYESNDLTVQFVNPPIMIHMPIEEGNFIKQFAQIFKAYGFEIESIGEQDYLLRGVPYELEELGNKESFQNFVDELFEESAITPTPRLLKDKIAMCACKAAVKGNNHLDTNEAVNLIKEMMKLDNPYHCPHGRPTMIKLTKKEIEKHFGRIV